MEISSPNSLESQLISSVGIFFAAIATLVLDGVSSATIQRVSDIRHQR